MVTIGEIKEVEWRELRSPRIGYLSTLNWIVGITQGDPVSKAEYAWMNMPINLANDLARERVDGQLIKFPTRAIHLPNGLTRDDIVVHLASLNPHNEADFFLLPRATTFARLIYQHHRELGLTKLNEHERTVANMLTIGGASKQPVPQEIFFPLDTLIPTSSTDSKGGVVALELRKSTGRIRRPLVIFSTHPKETKFSTVVPIMKP